MKSNTWNPIGLVGLAIGVVLGGAWVIALGGGNGILPAKMMSPNLNLDSWATVLTQLFMLVIFALSIAAVVSLVLWLGRSAFGIAERPALSESPEGILKMRFAKGEITRDQFNEMRHVLAEQASA